MLGDGNDEDNDDDVTEEVAAPTKKKSKKKKKKGNKTIAAKEEDEPVQLAAEEAEVANAEGGVTVDETTTAEQDQTTPSEGNSTSKNKSKNRKKGKGKGKKAVDEEEDDIDALVDRINSMGSESPKPEADSAIDSTPASKRILSFDRQDLDPDRELKRLFGGLLTRGDIRSVNKSLGKEGGSGGGHGAGRGKGRGGIKPRSSVAAARKFALVNPKPEWPPVGPGITMEHLGLRDGAQYYKLQWSPMYRDIQGQFYTLVASHDPRTLQQLLMINPYHVDTLLQLSQVCLQTGDYHTAGDLVERCMYAFGCGMHPSFMANLHDEGNARLEYDGEENKSLFLTLFRYIQILGRRGCPNTALNWCKLLLTLDPSDPLYVSMIIDYYALKSRSFTYLLQLYFTSEKWTTLPVGAMPNFKYSVALAKFHLEQKASSSSKTEATLSGSDVVSQSPPSDDLLQEALIMFPSVLLPLVKKAKVDLPPALAEHGYLSSTPPVALDHLITLFVERNAPLWGSPEVAVWLRAGVSRIIDRVNAASLRTQIEQAREVVMHHYAVPPNTFHHLLLSEYADAISSLPPEVAEAYRGALGVPDAPRNPQQVQQLLGANGHDGGLGYMIYEQAGQQQGPQAIPLPTANPLALFLRTLMPWMPVPNTGEVDPNFIAEQLAEYADFEDGEDEDW
eukprot:TRINITY_DN1366_c0_g1_i2.p2 TRINITY_DN1366_c0_g1~~TRINITY_DN1366_c0_g1_i2.p2  ORF type:complete len:675 (+),score=200.60 TRINITY_DN1366_c0_g1_i2:2572-4596(+)